MRRRTAIALVAAVSVAAVIALVALDLRGPQGAADGAGTPASGALEGTGSGLQVDPVPWQGVVWQRIETRGIDLKPGHYVSGLVPVAGGLLALGQGPLDRPNPNGLTSTLTVWRSPDGVAWHPTPILAGVRVDSVSEGRHVAAGPLGIAIAGNTCCGEEGPAVWWSPDGERWERASFPRAADTYLTGIAAGDHGFVAIGSTSGRSAIWTSPDGLAWTAVDDAAAGLVKGEVGHAVPVSEGFLVAGMDDRAGRDSNAALWLSDGLERWRRVAAGDPALAGPDEASMQRLVPFAGGLFATGGSGTQAERVQCERLLGGGLLTAGPATALSCGWLREMTWRSLDGSSWERVDPWGADGTYPPEPLGPHGRAPISWDRVVAAGPGLVGVLVELVNGQPGAEHDVLGVWGSADGRTWERIADGPPAGAAVISGVVAFERKLYALTETGTAWLGTALP